MDRLIYEDRSMKIQFIVSNSNLPSDIAVSSARTCYNSKGIILPDESENWQRKNQLLEDIFKSGHHTTLQHTHITMVISGISRHLIWRLLHSHSSYNSEQVSQRYAKVSLENIYFPKNINRERWKNFYTNKFSQYNQLIKLLEKPISDILPKFKKRDAIKKAQEIARYLLPQGVTAYLYHTVNILTILRYIVVAPNLPEAKQEGQKFASILEENLLKLDPSFKPLIDFVKNEKATFPNHNIEQYRKQGLVFDVVGNLDFEVNENYGGIMRTSQTLFDNGIIGGFSSYMKLSLSADAQNQRHRRSLAIRPSLEENLQEEFYVPKIIKQVAEAEDIYIQSIQESYQFFQEEKQQIGFSEAVYILPNSHLIEIVERNDWSSFHHKAQMRLCFNAQEEIYDIVYKQIKVLREMGINGVEKLLPPCGIRAKLGLLPICPEGNRFCGVKVWKQQFSDYKRDI